MNKLLNEKRERHLRHLLEEAVINVLVEQEQSTVPPASTPPAQNTNVNDTDVQSPSAPAQQNVDSNNEAQPFDVDQMVDKLNVLRGAKSFKDPEVYGRLTTFFKTLSDEQKAVLDDTLTELGRIVIDATENQAAIPDQTKQSMVSKASQAVSQVPANKAQAAPVSPAAPQAPAV